MHYIVLYICSRNLIKKVQMEIKQKEDRSRTFLAAILIFVGVVWMISELGIYFRFHEYLMNLFQPFRDAFRGLFRILFSWQMILIFVGLILMAGKRSSGVVLIIIGTIFIIPKVFIWPALNTALFFPILLVAIGISLIVKRNRYFQK